jgi:hypothetical protein
MESLAMSSGVDGGGAVDGASTALVETAGDVATSLSAAGVRATRTSAARRCERRPGMSFGHDVLLALIMAVVMAATVLLYR